MRGDSLLWLAQAVQDFRHALRSMRRAPAFTIAVILTLALGTGATTAVFSVIDAVLLRPLSYPEADRIVQFFLTASDRAIPGASIPDFRFWLMRADSVEDIAAYDFEQSEMGLTSGVPEQVHGIHVTSNYFHLFGAPALLGRTFDKTDDRVNGAKVVILSYDLWKNRFAADGQIVGKAISLDKEWYTVIGVTGRDFHSEPETQLWIPFQFDLNSTDQLHSFAVAARLKPGVTLGQANAQLDAASESARRVSELPDPHFRFQFRRLHDAMVGDTGSSLLILQGAVGFVLLIACGNFANLLLVRTIVRRREFAIRGALGASAGRLARQLIAESLLVSFAGSMLGVVAGIPGVRLLLTTVPDGAIPGITAAGITFDWRVMGFAAGLSVATGLFFGIFPMLTVLREKLTGAMQEGGSRYGPGVRARWLQGLTVMSEVALSVVLLIGAALLVRTFISLNRVDPGFERNNLLTMTMPLGSGRSESAASLADMVHRGREQVAAIPGVEAAAATFSPPFASRLGFPFTCASSSPVIAGDGEWISASAGYFEALRIPVLRGRAFDMRDGRGASPVVMINEAMATRYWPKGDALGQQIVIGKGLGPKLADGPRTIIGIFANTRDNDLAQAPEPTMAIPDAQTPDGMVELMSQFGPMWWMVRTKAEARRFVREISGRLRAASGGRPVGTVRTMDEVLARSIARQRFNMLLSSILASMALLLAAVGIWGVMAYSVAQRRREIGVRIALGADRTAVRNMVLREGLMKGTAGILFGICGAFFVVRVLSGFLFCVSVHDTAVFIAAPVALELVTAIATFAPAQMAARLNAVKALRLE